MKDHVTTMTIEEVDKFIVDEAKKQRVRFSEVNAKYKQEFGNDSTYLGDIVGNYITESMPLDMKLRNLMAYQNNNTAAGLYYLHENISMRRSLKKEKTLKQAMFLFILRNGLMTQFQDFIKHYTGDVEEDIYDEYCALK